VDGRFLTDSRKQFRCALRMPSEKEMESFRTHLKKFPAPTVPLEGSLVKIQCDHPLESELPEVVGSVVIRALKRCVWMSPTTASSSIGSSTSWSDSSALLRDGLIQKSALTAR
jgi:hypothetical protein